MRRSGVEIRIDTVTVDGIAPGDKRRFTQALERELNALYSGGATARHQRPGAAGGRIERAARTTATAIRTASKGRR